MAHLRVAVVHSYYSAAQPSGENGVVEAEVSALRNAGHTVGLVSLNTDDAATERMYRGRAALRVATGYGRNPLSELRDFSPDVVHVHNLYPNFARQWTTALEVPLVTTLHNYRLECPSGILYRDGSSCTDCLGRVAFPAVRHACYRKSRVATLPLAIAASRPTRRDPVVKTAARCIVLSERMLNLMVSQGVPAAKLEVWPNFLPDSMRPPPPTSRRRSFWLYAGRVSEEKGVLDLVRRWPNSIPLMVVGAGPELAQLKREACPSVEFLGLQERATVLAMMTEAIGLVFPSKWHEGFPLTYPESLASGLPILALSGNNVADLVAKDGTGYAASWDEIRPDLLMSLEETFGLLREGSVQKFEELYSEQAYIKRAEALYAGVVRASAVDNSISQVPDGGFR